jgi:hypothetical protein
MRLARLVAAGLVIGVVAGFVVALLRSRSQPGVPTGGTADPGNTRERATEPPEESPAIDVRPPRRTVSG